MFRLVYQNSLSPRFKQCFLNKNVVLPFPASFQPPFSVSLPLKDNQPGPILIKGDIGLNCSIYLFLAVAGRILMVEKRVFKGYGLQNTLKVPRAL